MTTASTVLIVDDVPLNVALLAALVNKLENMTAVTFCDPRAALDWCSTGQPDLILLDYAMPGMDGPAFIQRLRATEQGNFVPIVMVTAKTDRGLMLEALAAGANDFLSKPVDEIELAARATSMVRLGRAARDLYRLAATDTLTGLDSRRHLLVRLDEEIVRSARYQTGLGVVMFDIDHFKHVNDSFGHAGGDAVLREIGAHVRQFIRDTDRAGRLGGEEFGWVLPSTDSASTHEAAKRLRQSIETLTFPIAGRITASFGLTNWVSGDTVEAMLARADKALYQAKTNGRNTVVVA